MSTDNELRGVAELLIADFDRCGRFLQATNVEDRTRPLLEKREREAFKAGLLAAARRCGELQEAFYARCYEDKGAGAGICVDELDRLIAEQEKKDG